jgi:hypothetical protein
MALMHFEFQIELGQVFPILENLSLVKNGDLIVSDTYYEKKQIQEILQKIGLRKKVNIYATARGKSSGNIWNTINQKHHIACHTGDSLHSDVHSPESNLICALHYQNSQLSLHEQKMIEFTQEQLGFMMRALRLQNPYLPSSAEYLLWNDQCQINIPLLIHASLYLNMLCKMKKKHRILFASRDGCLWILIFKKLFPNYESVYFHSSRYAYTFPSNDFIHYVRQTYTEDTIIVDSHGSGISCTQFFEKHLKKTPFYLSIVNNKKTQHAIVRTKARHETIEKLNYDLIGTFYDIDQQKPLRSQPEYDLRFIKPSHLCVSKCLDLLSEYQIFPFDRRVVKWASDSAWSQLAIDRFVDHASHHTHIKDEDRMRHIHVLSTGEGFEA